MDAEEWLYVLSKRPCSWLTVRLWPTASPDGDCKVAEGGEHWIPGGPQQFWAAGALSGKCDLPWVGGRNHVREGAGVCSSVNGHRLYFVNLHLGSGGPIVSYQVLSLEEDPLYRIG